MRHLFKKLIVWTLCLMMTVGTLPGLARGAKAAAPDAGTSSGLAKDDEGYYLISNYDELLAFADIVNNKGENDANAKLTGDIDASASKTDRAWTPIGTNTKRYKGKFDGKGFKIEKLTTNDESAFYVGLFGCVGEDGSVQNVGLVGGSLTGNTNVGGVVGWLSGGTVSNCYNTGTVSGIDGDDNRSGAIGGVVGDNSIGIVLDCYNTGVVSGNFNVGGVVGWNSGTVSNCYNTGAASGRGNSIGGVVGYNVFAGKVSNCYNTSTVSGSERVGGVVGYIVQGTVTNCYNIGAVTGSDKVGGAAGSNEGTVSNCYNTGKVIESGGIIGGVVGWNERTVSNCYNTGDVTGSGNYVGGVVGCNFRSCEVSNCYNTGDVEGDIDVGGVVGSNEGTVSNCYNTGKVIGIGGRIGGVAGYSSKGTGTVSNCYYNISLCQIDKAFGYGSGTNVTGLTTLQMIGASSELWDNLKDVKDDDENLVWLFRRNIDGKYYYPHLAGFNFDESGNQLATDGIPANEWPNRGTFSFALSGYQFTYTGEIYKPKVDGKVIFDYDEMTEFRVKYLDSENNEVEPKKAGTYRACVCGKEAGSSYLERDFKILSIRAILTADSASAECDGTALTKNSYMISGLAKGDSVESVTITGSQTGPGSCDNVPSAAKIVNVDGEDVTDCYDITYVNGKLTVSEHSFEQEVADAKYQKSEADCIHAAVYYKSCKCGEKGTETFESGKPLGHDYKAVEGSAVAPTCEKAGKEADQKCERCGDVITGKEIPATGHTWKAATGYAPKTCEICGATEGDVIKYNSEAGKTIEHTKDDAKDETVTYHRSEDDKHAIAHYKGVQIDGKDVKVDAKSGSVILTFDAATLNALGVGDHVIKVIFDDWVDELKLVIKAPVAPIADATPTTGDSSLPVLWVTLLLLSMAGASAVVMRRRKRA